MERDDQLGSLSDLLNRDGAEAGVVCLQSNKAACVNVENLVLMLWRRRPIINRRMDGSIVIVAMRVRCREMICLGVDRQRMDDALMDA